MHKNKWRKWSWGLCAFLAQPIWAQPVSRSVHDLIETIKNQREMVLTPSLQASRVSSTSTLKTEVHSRPLLWSVTGLNDEYSAVLIIAQKAYTVRSRYLPMSVGGWSVNHVNADSVCLSQKRQAYCLDAPDSSSSVNPFLKALPTVQMDDESLATSTPTARAPIDPAVEMTLKPEQTPALVVLQSKEVAK